MEKKFVDKERMEKTVEKMFGVFLDGVFEDTPDGISKERQEITREKYKLLFEQKRLEDKLGEVTRNTYEEIGKIMNDLIREQNRLLVEYHDKCQKWLDDNNMPYCDDEEEDDE